MLQDVSHYGAGIIPQLIQVCGPHLPITTNGSYEIALLLRDWRRRG